MSCASAKFIRKLCKWIWLLYHSTPMLAAPLLHYYDSHSQYPTLENFILLNAYYCRSSKRKPIEKFILLNAFNIITTSSTRSEGNSQPFLLANALLLRWNQYVSTLLVLFYRVSVDCVETKKKDCHYLLPSIVS